MMKIRSIRYYINEAFIGLFRNRLMVLASIVTVASCILTVSLSFCIAYNLDGILKEIENTIGLTAYIDDSLDSEQVKELFESISEIPYIKTVNYISSEVALKSFKENLGDDNQIFAGLEIDNPLPRSFEIELLDATAQSDVIKILESMSVDGISKVRHEQSIVDALTSINNGIRIASLIIILILLMTSIIIIINTIRLTVTNRKLEINIMKYVGATDSFIRWPFIIEGMLIGLFGSGLPIIICWFLYPETIKIIYDKLPMLRGIVVFKSALSVFSVLTPIAIGLGVIIGIIGSVSSISKHLHV